LEGKNVVKHPQPEGVQTYTTEGPNYSGLEYQKIKISGWEVMRKQGL